MAETLMTTGLGAAFSGTGQTIPDDIEELDIARLARSVCGDRALAAASGA
jgi:flagellar biosynthesis GTPase FlhF